jgi:membrane-bound serine protease (ClpP class)
MEFLLSPNVAYLLVFIGVMLLLLSFNDTKYSLPKVGAMLFCLLAGGVEFFVLHGNPWAFLIVALSPLPYFVVIRQERVHNPLFLLTILMLTMGSFFLFVDENKTPIVNYGLAASVSLFGSTYIWLTVQQMSTARRRPLIADTLVGMTGEVWIAIEPFSAGSVRIEGELWRARSKEAIPAGATVRVIRQDGITLTVKKMEKINKAEN